MKPIDKLLTQKEGRKERRKDGHGVTAISSLPLLGGELKMAER